MTTEERSVTTECWYCGQQLGERQQCPDNCQHVFADPEHIAAVRAVSQEKFEAQYARGQP